MVLGGRGLDCAISDDKQAEGDTDFKRLDQARALPKRHAQRT